MMRYMTSILALCLEYDQSSIRLIQSTKGLCIPSGHTVQKLSAKVRECYQIHELYLVLAVNAGFPSPLDNDFDHELSFYLCTVATASIQARLWSSTL
ncbi:hypothetical protein FACS1894188_13370 [Clostridia bacterium]|nr:hypothetical protein FACS1894188_13370 [Clostridia bacterium]